MEERVQQRSGPKEGKSEPTPSDWKEAVKLEMGNRGWNQSDLARRCTELGVETTPAAISWVLTKAKRSALKPIIEHALNWRSHVVDPIVERVFLGAAERKGLSTEEAQRQLDDLKNTAARLGPLSDLQNAFRELDEAGRAKLLAHARYLVALQRAEIEHERALVAARNAAMHSTDVSLSKQQRLALADMGRQISADARAEAVLEVEFADQIEIAQSLVQDYEQTLQELEAARKSLDEAKEAEHEAEREAALLGKQRESKKAKTAQQALDAAQRRRRELETRRADLGVTLQRLAEEVRVHGAARREALKQWEQRTRAFVEARDRRRAVLDGMDPQGETKTSK